MRSLFKITLSLSLLFAHTLAFAGINTSLMQTAAIKKVGEFEVKAQADIIFNNGGGFNFSPHLVTGVIEHFIDVDTYLGVGTTDFQFGAMGKYNLLPDLEGQVGLSFNLGFGFIRDEQLSSFLTTLGVLTSKQFEMSFGHLTPYGSLQLQALLNSFDSTVPLTLIGGAKAYIKDLKLSVYAELGANLHSSTWLLGLGAGYDF